MTQPLNETQIALGELLDPAPGLIVVQVETREEVTKSGLVIPVDVARSVHEQRPVQGTVVAVGQYDEDDDLESDIGGEKPFVEVGNHVIFGRYTGTRVEWIPPGKRKDERQVCVLMRAADVLAKVRTPEQAKSLKVRT